ncbi:Methyl-accepting chemotaxis protein (plasmid) [Nostoc flagelliforme CCNUN1]|uniref:Methyl-accepting chemotaxis protein n=1 Tax=Nostoc flagelliforme CCNUN1 TaxID=2038116 RepID=A0A2K8T5X0_9NOSO|nr:hypothetical protein [Nostoc flagelliforme]AUB43108.1 Methyl-accepting chemotaxis protein [Nostoc flagelliforme CCNUN1]
MAATITRPKPKKAGATSKPQSPYKRLHVIIPIEDMLWASQQKPSVNQLWQECWTADPYGSRWMPLTSALGYSTFISAKKILCDSGLFIFKPDKSIQDGRETASWMVKNLHGSRMKEFWEKANSENQQPDSLKQEPSAEISEKDAGCEEMGALYEASILGQSQSEQGFQKPSRTAQEHLTNSSKEFVRCVSDTLNEILPCEETAYAPLGGASPQTVESVSEKEIDLPTAMDCTMLTLVDNAPSQSTSLLAENQDCGDEPKNCHEGTFSAAPVAKNEFSLNFAMLAAGVAIANQIERQVEQSNSASLLVENSVSGVEIKAVYEGTCSAAPVAQNEFSLNSAMPAAGVAIANQTQEQVEQGYSAMLLVENSVSGVEVKAVDEGESSAAPVPNIEKWSHEAIVARANVRPERMQKLKVAANSGQNPGFDFLQECWNDDPGLQIVIKKLLAKFPQWGVAVVDGELAN